MLHQKVIRKRYTSNHPLTRDQAHWLCKAILTHYSQDKSLQEKKLDEIQIFNRVHKSPNFKRGRDWAVHPVGYDLKEEWYGTPTSGFREAWAALVSLPIPQKIVTPDNYRTYTLYGLVNKNEMKIAVYRITEVTASSTDRNFLKYVFDCLARLVDDATESPEYDPLHR